MLSNYILHVERPNLVLYEMSHSGNNNGGDSPQSNSLRSRSINSAGQNHTRPNSPDPSIRHISNKRVNNSRQPESNRLLDNRSPSNLSDYSSINNNSHNIDESLQSPNKQHDFDQGSTINENSNHLNYQPSLNYMNQASTASSIRNIPESSTSDSSKPTSSSSEYTPAAAARSINNLDWRVVLPYYLPFLSWIHEYTFSYFLGDLIGGLSLATFQIPLCLSYATSLAHVPVICGLYSLGIAPLIYMMFGSVPQMVVGPEAPISLVVGQAVEPLLHHAKKKNLDPIEYVVAITVVSGASLLGFGLGRFGFLDNVLNESLLKGFISGVGLVMIINALISMLGINGLLDEITKNPEEQDIHSPFDKLKFLLTNYEHLHWLTFKVSLIGFLIIMSVRLFKSYAQKHQKSHKLYEKAIYIPEILIVVLISTYLCQIKDWENQGILVIGHIKTSDSFHVYNPFSPKIWPLIKSLSTSGFVCAMLGFFESTTALKSLGSTYNLPISSNRELVALGFINIVGSMFGSLPAFGGYGRSKINAISAKTTTSGAIMGVITLISAKWVKSYLYFVPKCLLSVITGVIGILLIDEAPKEIVFHWKSRGYNELLTFAATVLTTFFFSMEAGIAVGLIYSLIRVIKNSAQSRIQILGRYPGTNTFLDADTTTSATSANKNVVVISDDATKLNTPSNFFQNLRDPNPQYNVFTDDNFRHLNTQALEEIEGCLIIKIPEPLTFVNTNDLKSRLKRVEMYGSTKTHPAMKRTRDVSMTKYIIFDLNGMSFLDSSASQILVQLLETYKNRNIRSFFVRVKKDEELRSRLKSTGITNLLIDDLNSIKFYESTNIKNREIEGSLIVNQNQNENENHNENENESDSSQNFESLIESPNEPFFSHISDALKVIDKYDSMLESDIYLSIEEGEIV